ncbi:DUF998 domain-containing protein [Herbiconiux moechotypicola]|uniref:DUF998 domain-containing protein n=1 Tax=Herbiconiux moechotypicola TaxID=637393 RepID=A0ABN3DQX5_9MICO|nr:DUF998 domain-containing protein [Herbiconiux moechotypicola]MCS5731738.1 DUF998 domain-containing protein [Herbiconiux moechotypicola]
MSLTLESRTTATVTAARVAGLAVAATSAATGLVLIWVARLSADRFLYVSEMGAPEEPTAAVFQLAMVLVAASALLAAASAPILRPSLRWLAVLPSGAVLALAGVAFGVASQVTCTQYCPLPVGDAFTWQDLIHTGCAVIGFVAASFVMLQAAAERRYRGLSRLSLGSAISVAVIAGVGGLLSLLRLGTDLGGVLELIATTVALAWLVGLAVFFAIELVRRPAPQGLP